jgi:hypothetical protein
MLNTTLVITKETFEESAKCLVEQLQIQALRTKQIQDFDITLAREFMAQILFDQTYSVLKEKLDKDTPRKNKAPSVLILCYGEDAILTVNGEYNQRTSSTGSDEDVNLETLKTIASSVSTELGEDFGLINLPRVLSPEYESFDVIALTEKMGYFSNKETIFEFLSRNEVEFFIDDRKAEVNMPLDWVESLEEKVTKRHHGFSISDINEIIIWDTFVSGSPDNIYFTFGELIDAQYIEEQDFWMVDVGGDMLTIQTKQKV